MLKSHDGIQNLEFVSRNDADFSSRTAFYGSSRAGRLGVESFGVTRLYRGFRWMWFTMGAIFLADGRRPGWLMLRCGAWPIVTEFVRN